MDQLMHMHHGLPRTAAAVAFVRHQAPAHWLVWESSRRHHRQLPVSATWESYCIVISRTYRGSEWYSRGEGRGGVWVGVVGYMLWGDRRGLLAMGMETDNWLEVGVGSGISRGRRQSSTFRVLGCVLNAPGYESWGWVCWFSSVKKLRRPVDTLGSRCQRGQRE